VGFLVVPTVRVVFLDGQHAARVLSQPRLTLPGPLLVLLNLPRLLLSRHLLQCSLPVGGTKRVSDSVYACEEDERSVS
jgi:hypothetical protein